MPQSQPTGLVRAIGRWSLAALMLNIIIGSGIFGLPAAVAGVLGSWSPLAFVIAAVGLGVIAACFAEVASQFGESGGPYLYTATAFGRFPGLLTGWLNWLSRITASAASANLFSNYLADLWPAANQPVIRSAAMTFMVGGLAWINVRGVKMGTGVSNGFTAVKVLVLASFVAGGLIFVAFHGVPVPFNFQAHDGSTWLKGVLLVIFAFTGFEAALIPAGEVKDPQRDVPVALVASVGLATVLYGLIQLVLVMMLGASAPADHPLGAAAHIFGGNVGATLISLGALISVVGYLAAGMIASPRVTYAFAERGDFPRWFAAIHGRFRTPYISIITFAVLLWALALAGNFRANAIISAVSRLTIYALVCASLPALRKKMPESGRFRLPGAYFFVILGIGFAVAVASRMGYPELIALGITTALALINWLAVRNHPFRQNN
jgi:basic amino acid/polyamine antiporter, APA family